MAPSQTSMGGIGMRATHRRDRPRESPSSPRAAAAGSGPAKREARRLAALPLATRRQAMAVLAVGLRTFAELEGNGTITAARPGRGGRPSLYKLDVIVPKYLA